MKVRVRTGAVAAALSGLAVLAAACSGSASGSSSGTTPPTAAAAASTTSTTSPCQPLTSSPTTVAGSTGTFAAIAQPSPAGTFGTEPKIVVPSGPPPTRIESADLIEGTGPAVKAEDCITVQYVGVSYTLKDTFDASWTDPTGPFSFIVDPGQVIGGWAEGVVGMKVGGRRELIIPPALAYGPEVPPGAAGKIAPNDTLIFIVDLLKIN